MKKVEIKKTLEIRALPVLLEKRNDLLEEMEGLTTKAEAETRALSADELKRFGEIKEEIKAIDETLKAKEETRAMEITEPGKKKEVLEQRAVEEQKFLRFIRGEERALDIANNGGIIPTTIANKIIETVKDLCPIYSMATVYNIGGDLVFPVYDATTPIAAAYVDDLVELTEATGKFTTVKLQNFIIGCLAKVSKSLMNRNDFDLLSFVIKKVSEAIAEFLEKECLVGTTGKMTGVLSATQGITAASATAVTADELIDLQDSIPDVYQAGACWIMHKDTRKAIRKLKDSDGNYILNKDLTTPFGYTLLGKPVYISKSCPAMASATKAIAYGDMSGLVVKLAQNVELQTLNEKYATQHAVGVVAYIEADSKIVEPQKISVLTMKV